MIDTLIFGGVGAKVGESVFFIWAMGITLMLALEMVR